VDEPIEFVGTKWPNLKACPDCGSKITRTVRTGFSYCHCRDKCGFAAKMPPIGHEYRRGHVHWIDPVGEVSVLRTSPLEPPIQG